MQISKIVFTILILFSIFAPSVLAGCKNEPPTKNTLETMFGKPVRCYPEGAVCYDESQKKIECPKESVAKLCYRTDNGLAITADFDTSGKLTGINLFHFCFYFTAVTAAEKLVPPENRGKFLKKTYITGEYECSLEYVEEYECLKIKYSSQKCTGCAPGGVTITWN